MNASDRKRSLTSEIADEITKKNGFEERRLQRRLQHIEQHALKQQQKRNNEQLVEYALENLSLEDMDTFNDLTRKILKSNFLPPIKRKPKSTGSHEDKYRDEMLAERLRGSKMIRKYMDGRNPRKLTRSLSADSGLIPECANQKEATGKKPGPYYTFLLKRRLIGSFSDAPRRQPVSNVGVIVETRTDDAKAGCSMTRRVHFADSENENGTSRSKRTVQNTEFSAGYVRGQGKIQHDSVSEAIEYKLKRRELERKLTQESIVKDK